MSLIFLYKRYQGEGVGAGVNIGEIINKIDEGQYKGVIWRGLDIFNWGFSDF